MISTDFSPWPSFSYEEADAVRAALLTNRVNYWTGDECRSFEKEFAAWIGSRYAVSLANGTLALDLSLHALGIGPGDEVIVTPRTFIASVSCVVNAGATPVFADVEPDSGNLSAATIERVVTEKTKAVICVHLAGWPCDMDPIISLAAQQGFKVIEDCAQAHGAKYKGRSVGTIGDIGAWSFCQDKIMTTGGEGGMVTTNSQELWSSMWSFKDHGKTWEAVYERQHPPGFRWVHDRFGTNWRMLELQAVIGRLQLAKMEDWHHRRTANAHKIAETCSLFSSIHLPRLSFALPRDSIHTEASRHAYYKLYAYVIVERLNEGWSRDRIVAEINKLGVPCYQGSCSEVYLERAFDGTPWRPKQPLPVARRLGQRSVMFLVHPTLTADEIAKTCNAISEVFSAATRAVCAV